MTEISPDHLKEFVKDNYEKTRVMGVEENGSIVVDSTEYKEFISSEDGLTVEDVTEGGYLIITIRDEETFRESYNKWLDEEKKL